MNGKRFQWQVVMPFVFSMKQEVYLFIFKKAFLTVIG